MTKEELIERLHSDCHSGDIESDHKSDHSCADYLLIDYINDDDVRRAYEDVDKWYA